MNLEQRLKRIEEKVKLRRKYNENNIEAPRVYEYDDEDGSEKLELFCDSIREEFEKRGFKVVSNFSMDKYYMTSVKVSKSTQDFKCSFEHEFYPFDEMSIGDSVQNVKDSAKHFVEKIILEFINSK